MPQPPKTYDDIVRKTVPEPDSSWRPSDEQVRQAREGFRALDTAEQELHDRVSAALAQAGLSKVEVEIEVDRERVTLRGVAADDGELRKIEAVVAGVSGVGEVHDQVVVQRS